jgi:hypothetical protein
VVVEHFQYVLCGPTNPSLEPTRDHPGAIGWHHILHSAITVITYTRHKLSAFEAVDELGGPTGADSLRGGNVAHSHALTQQKATHHLHLVDRNPAELGKLVLHALWHRRLESAAELCLGGYEPAQEGPALFHAKNVTSHVVICRAHRWLSRHEAPEAWPEPDLFEIVPSAANIRILADD